MSSYKGFSKGRNIYVVDVSYLIPADTGKLTVAQVSFSFGKVTRIINSPKNVRPEIGYTAEGRTFEMTTPLSGISTTMAGYLKSTNTFKTRRAYRSFLRKTHTWMNGKNNPPQSILDKHLKTL